MKDVFYFSVETCGDGSKDVRIYRMKDNKPQCIEMIDVAWGHDEEAAVMAYVEEHRLSKSFYCQSL